MRAISQPLLRALLTFCIASGLLLGLSATAHAYSYIVEPWSGCAGGYNSGQWDDDGRLYIPCGNPSTIRIYDSAGTLRQSVALGFYASDVAPAARGEHLYVAGGNTAPRRLIRTSDGAYVLDTSWKLTPYPMYGTLYQPRGHFLSTDASGYIYLADGAWSSNGTHTVIKYSPGGAFLTRFGEYAEKSWSTGSFYWMLTGLVASRDGRHVFTTEVGNNRVQRWDRGADGNYSASWSLGSTALSNPDRGGYCDFSGWRGTFAAPYDVALDGYGDLYVMNTTCKQVLKFTQSGGYVAGANVSLNGGDHPRPHGFAVAANGTVYIGETERLMRRSDLPWPPPPAPTTNAAPAPLAVRASPAPAATTCLLRARRGTRVGRVVLYGRVLGLGRGKRLYVARRRDARWIRITRTSTRRSGYFRVVVVSDARRYRVRWPGNASRRPCVGGARSRG